MTEEVGHRVAEVRPLGLRRWWAVCSCGFRAEPVDGSDVEAPAIARQLLVDGHGAEDVGFLGGVLEGEAGAARPGPSRPWTPTAPADRAPREPRLP